MECFFGPELDYSKQAYSQCRAKLQYQAYTALNRHFVSSSYKDGQYGKGTCCWPATAPRCSFP